MNAGATKWRKYIPTDATKCTNIWKNRQKVPVPRVSVALINKFIDAFQQFSQLDTAATSLFIVPVCWFLKGLCHYFRIGLKWCGWTGLG
jgi:hypothetical protein